MIFSITIDIIKHGINNVANIMSGFLEKYIKSLNQYRKMNVWNKKIFILCLPKNIKLLRTHLGRVVVLQTIKNMSTIKLS